MNINIIYDASVQNAPAGFKGAVADAVAFLDSVLTANVTVNIAVGYGEIDGLQLTPGAIGESSSFLTQMTYGQLLSTLPGELPATDPASSGQVVVTRSQEKVLGFLPADTTIDGFVGFSSTTPFTYDPNHRAQAGEYDFIGVVEHEITEVLGRISMLDRGSVSILDLFRYSAPGVHTGLASQAAYFSIDGGITNLNNFNNSGGGDLADWAASAGADSALAFIKPGVANLFGSTDITLMDALGYGRLPPSVEITSAGGLTSQPVQMVSGVSIGGAGTTVTLLDGQTQIGTAKVQSDGGWAIDVVLAPGSHVLAAQGHEADGTVITSGIVRYTVSAAAPPAGVLESLTPAEGIAAIYVGYFNRAPDPRGFAFWENQSASANGHNLGAIANLFALQPETLNLYPFLGSGPMNPSSSTDVNGVQVLVSSIYNNLLDRSVNAASDPGAQFWVHALLTGQVALGQAILDIANGATGADAQVLLNKVIAADYFVSASGGAGLGQSSPSATLLSNAHMALMGIGADAASVAVAEAKIDGFFHS